MSFTAGSPPSTHNFKIRFAGNVRDFDAATSWVYGIPFQYIYCFSLADDIDLSGYFA